MDTTMILAQIWGPIMLAVGLGMFISRNYYLKLYRELEKETLAVLIFGMFGMAAGIAHIRFHNTWDTFAQVIISLLGWLLFIKAAAFAITPGLVDRSGDFQVKIKLIPAAGVAMLVLGAYLSWIGYFA